MRINVADIIKAQGAIKKISMIESDFDTSNIIPRIQLSKPIQLEGKLEISGDKVHLSGNLKTEVIVSCDRCASDLIYQIESEVTDSFGQSTSDDEEDIKPMTHSMVDLSETVTEAILLALPMKVLCSDNCKGMCSICGQNLNERTCDCDKEYTDPRLEKFKSLF